MNHLLRESSSGRVVQQAYDAIGRLCTVGNSGATCSSGTTFASGFAYNTAFQVTGFNYGNGVAAAFGYSPDRLQLTSLAYTKNTTTLLNLGYAYTQNGGNNGQIASITDNTGTPEAGRSVTYTYDALYRLSTAVTTGSTSYPQWGLSWTYDRYGNRLAQTVTAGAGVPSNSVTVDATTNRITGAPYAYDANGNMTNDGANSLTYDAQNRAVTAAGATYTYDGKGLRVKKVSGSTTTVYIFSGSKVIAEFDNGALPASPSREYIYTGSQLTAKIEAGATTYFHADHLSARLVTDSTGTVTGQQGHFPYGESWYGSSVTKWKFTTYERDTESGNDYAMFRTHVNRLGRFSSPDPLAGSLADPQSLNRFAYTLDDPTNLIDPLGLDGECHADANAPGGVTCTVTASAPYPRDFGPGGSPRLGNTPWGNGGLDSPSAIPLIYGRQGTGGGGGSVLQAFPKAANKALKIVALSADCQKFLTDVLQNSLLALYGVSTAADLNVPTQNVYNAIGKYGPMAAALSGAAASATKSPKVNPQSGDFHTNAQANFDSFSITFYSGYFGLSSTNQAQIIIHEGSHLLFNFSDQQLAGAAGKPSVDPSQASANYQAELQKHCH